MLAVFALGIISIILGAWISSCGDHHRWYSDPGTYIAGAGMAFIVLSVLFK